MQGLIEKIMRGICVGCHIPEHIGMDWFYFIFRIMVGFMFMQHGIQKLFGGLGGVDGQGATVPLFGLYGLAGLIEFFGGLAVGLGLFTRLFALIASVEMLLAYFIAHSAGSLFPVLNKGELALVYFASFLVIAIYGAGKGSLERTFWGKEIF